MDWTLDELLENWRITHDDMHIVLQPYQSRLDLLNSTIARIAEPYRDALRELEAEIRPLITANAKTYKGDGAEARYRKGARRVTYDWRYVDTVRDVLHDILPETALCLDSARKETTGEPSVSIVRV